jgi:hypothetical protein
MGTRQSRRFSAWPAALLCERPGARRLILLEKRAALGIDPLADDIAGAHAATIPQAPTIKGASPRRLSPLASLIVVGAGRRFALILFGACSSHSGQTTHANLASEPQNGESTWADCATSAPPPSSPQWAIRCLMDGSNYFCFVGSLDFI